MLWRCQHLAIVLYVLYGKIVLVCWQICPMNVPGDGAFTMSLTCVEFIHFKASTHAHRSQTLDPGLEGHVR